MDITQSMIDHAEYARKQAVRAEAVQSDWYQNDIAYAREEARAEMLSYIIPELGRVTDGVIRESIISHIKRHVEIMNNK